MLVDTSLWIRFFANRAPPATELDCLLDRDEVTGHQFSNLAQKMPSGDNWIAMASFTGTKKEFRRYIGPFLRNVVQQITKKHRVNRRCKECNSPKHLQAAHVYGRDRNQITDSLLEEFIKDEIVRVNLSVIEQRFKAEHQPLERSILILCRTCHTKYDSVHGSGRRTSRSPVNRPTQTRQINETHTLPIHLVPADPIAFKQKLLQSRKARIVTTYSDDHKETEDWYASKLSAQSNVIGNLRSRAKFRRGWQERGIVQVTVTVLKH
jgi:hypothetical protein